MNPLRLTGPEAGVIKYDLLTALSVAGLNGSPTLQTSLMRLIAAVTSRYNWRADELSVGQRDLARMWSVNERTVKREIKRLTDAQLLICTRGGVRGRAVTPAGGLRRVMCGCRRAVRGGMLGGGLLRALLLLFEQGVDLELKDGWRRRGLFPVAGVVPGAVAGGMIASGRAGRAPGLAGGDTRVAGLPPEFLGQGGGMSGGLRCREGQSGGEHHSQLRGGYW